MKTFLCKRFPPEGKEVAPEECARNRSLIPPGKELTLAEKRALADKGITGMIERMPTPCEHCKDWERLCKTALEDPGTTKPTKKIPEPQTVVKEPKPQASKGHRGRKKREFSREEIDRVIQALNESKSINAACRSLGMRRSLFYKMARRHPEIEDLLKHRPEKNPPEIPLSLQSPEAFLEAVSGLQKSQPAAELDHTITLDFTMFEGLLDKLKEKAQAKLRTLHNQIIWELRWVLKEAPNARAEDASRDDL